jgi:GTPase SAR1 family protein
MNGAIIVYDVAKRTTFEHVRYWLQNIREKGDANVQIFLVGHKTDQSRREVSADEAEQYAIKEHIMYAETSIKDPASIINAFKKFIVRSDGAIQRLTPQCRIAR